MKEHITAKQLDELSKKGKKRLMEYAENIALHAVYIVEFPSEYLPILSIGRMIEFLQKYLNEDDAILPDFTNNCWKVSICEKNIDWWENEEHTEKEKEKVNWKEYEHKELCDALWQATKEILEALLIKRLERGSSRSL
jgi:hypothetical protein